MKTKSLIVKEKSLDLFLEEHLINGGELQFDDGSTRKAFGEEMYFKHGNGINIGDFIEFQFCDITKITSMRLVVTMTYVANPYDDISIKMVLQDVKYIREH